MSKPERFTRYMLIAVVVAVIMGLSYWIVKDMDSNTHNESTYKINSLSSYYTSG